MRTAKTLIRLGRCQGWSEPSLAVHVILLVLSCCGSIINELYDKKMDLASCGLWSFKHVYAATQLGLRCMQPLSWAWDVCSHSAGPEMYAATQLGLRCMQPLSWAWDVRSHSAGPEMYAATQLGLRCMQPLSWAWHVRSHSAGPEMYAATQLGLRCMQPLSWAWDVHSHSAGPEMYTATRLGLRCGFLSEDSSSSVYCECEKWTLWWDSGDRQAHLNLSCSKD